MEVTLKLLEKKDQKISAIKSRQVTIPLEYINAKYPLHKAAANNAKEVAELLIQKGANIEAQEENQYTPLHRAAKNNAKEVAELLIQKGANIEAQDQWQCTPLHNTVYTNAKEAAELLIQKGANIEAQNDEGKTPLVIAKEQGHPEMVKLLEDAPKEIKRKKRKLVRFLFGRAIIGKSTLGVVRSEKPILCQGFSRKIPLSPRTF